MYVKVLYDDKAKRGLKSGHGFSCLVNGKILFDSGEGADALLENMKRMMVPMTDIEAIVVSHDHWDHTGGLWELLKLKKALKIYACSEVSDTFKKCVKELGGKLILVEKPMEISENIFVSGDMTFSYKDEPMGELALVVKGDKGLSVISGCAHPGIVNVLQSVKDNFKAKKLYMVFGGFHLDGMNREKVSEVINDFKDLPVAKAGPSHCSGDVARRMFKGKYRDDYVEVKAGHIIHL